MGCHSGERLGDPMDLKPGDVLELKKAHPCGKKQWLVLRTGGDLHIRCVGCGHELTVPQLKIEKNIRRVIKNSSTELSGN